MKFKTLVFISLISFMVLMPCFSSGKSTVKEEQTIIEPLQEEEEFSQEVQENTDSIESVFVNQVGYLPQGEKYFITTIPTQEFYLLDQDGAKVFTGTVELRIEEDPSTGYRLYKGDFSAYTEPGDYMIQLDNGEQSYSFVIGQDIYNDVAKKSILSFYYQRCGLDLPEEYAGDFAHEACHTREGIFHSSVDESEGTREVSGGWHDAGDYGRYVHSAASSLAMMLIMYELHPEKFDFDDNNIPESGNQISDFVDEVVYELDWLLKMQNTDSESSFYGACNYMLNTLNYEWVAPENDWADQFIYNYSTVATADFAAIMAQASRLMEEIDTERSQRYLDAALLSWSYLEEQSTIYPFGGFQRPSDTHTGGYAGSADPSDRDERLWAATELFITTGDERFHSAAEELGLSSTDFSVYNWLDTSSFGLVQYVLSDQSGKDSAIEAQLTNSFKDYCNEIVLRIDQDGFHDSLDSYHWGCIGDLMIHGAYLIYGASLFPEEAQGYEAGALRVMNHLLGVNAHNISFVTHTGADFPRNIHHAGLTNDGVDDIYPGMVPGGPNASIYGDYTLPEYFSEDTPPALCYIDHVDSWASNENCVLYNAPVVALAFYFANL